MVAVHRGKVSSQTSFQDWIQQLTDVASAIMPRNIEEFLLPSTHVLLSDLKAELASERSKTKTQGEAGRGGRWMEGLLQETPRVRKLLRNHFKAGTLTLIATAQQCPKTRHGAATVAQQPAAGTCRPPASSFQKVQRPGPAGQGAECEGVPEFG